LKINSITIVLAILLIISLIPTANAQAQTMNGTITGVVLDRIGRNVPNATVTLLQYGQLFATYQNPQQSNNVPDPYIAIGRYQFSKIPYGQYTIVTEKPDAAGIVHTAYLTVDLDANTTTADIVITDLVFAPMGTAIPSSSPSTAPSPSPTHTPLCTIGLIFPVLGICLLMVNKKK